MIKIIAKQKSFVLSVEDIIHVGEEYRSFIYLKLPISCDEFYTPLEFRSRKILMRQFIIANQNGTAHTSIILPSEVALNLRVGLENLRVASRLLGGDHEVDLSRLFDLEVEPTKEEFDKWLDCVKETIARQKSKLVETVLSESQRIANLDKRIAEIAY